MVSMALDRAFSALRHLGLKTRLQFLSAPNNRPQFEISEEEKKPNEKTKAAKSNGCCSGAWISASLFLPAAPIMAANPNLPYGDDSDSLPCAAPTPLPPPPSQSLTPDPEVRFSPEAISDDPGAIRLEPPSKMEAPSIPPEVPHTPIRLERELSRVSADDPMLPLPPPSLLAVPAPHSTLALGAEVQAVREQGFNARQAAEELVQRSFVARCALEARVGGGMNIPRDQQLYQGLVSLQVPKEELVNSAIQEKLTLFRHRPEGRQEPPRTGPDLLAFYDPEELFTETPFLEVEGLPLLKLQPQPRDPASTFFMYRKLHQWES